MFSTCYEKENMGGHFWVILFHIYTYKSYFPVEKIWFYSYALYGICLHVSMTIYIADMCVCGSKCCVFSHLYVQQEPKKYACRETFAKYLLVMTLQLKLYMITFMRIMLYWEKQSTALKIKVLHAKKGYHIVYIK